jgi:2-C-methyl-D-erythritol 4-phosphate cytidylyltransferase/2-C-methyl-D-erythritol 2,4-cyclodiphosphate synthase
LSDAASGRDWTVDVAADSDDRPDERDGAPFADAIVVAAGSSSRMGGVDKLDALVGGLPLLAYTLDAIAAAPEVRRIILVTSRARMDAMKDAGWLPAKLELSVTGGTRRQDSVRNGFVTLLANPPTDGGPDPEVILVHDGARPLVPTALVSAVAVAARDHGAAIPVLAVGDTVKRLADDGTVVGAGPRSTLAAAQTPQGIRTSWLRDAFARIPADTDETFTDEAALLEACKLPVHAIPGDERNLKVTLPGDLGRAATLLGAPTLPGPAPASDAGPVRVGFGTDSHPFGPALGLALGGLVIDGAPRLHGHSDGDVLLHAVADALLGAAGLGDLGRIFPAGPGTPAGIASGHLLGEVVQGVRSHGYVVRSIDCTVVAGRPRLAARLPAMGQRIAELLSVDPSAVNVKASTGNLDGMEGAGRGISATAVAVIGPRSDDR